KQWEHKGGPGHWPDCDMLQVGRLSKRGPVGEERYSRFTDDELYTHLTFWSIYQSPLMIGGHLPDNRNLEWQLLSNEEVIAVNQQGSYPTQLLNTDSSAIWVSYSTTQQAIYLAVFNLSSTTSTIPLQLKAWKLEGNWKLRDCWKKQDLGILKNHVEQKVNAHGAVLLKITTDGRFAQQKIVPATANLK
ncbi:MAG TPA: hypothetical protein VL307_16525, partial [Chitinophagaceae bacterium]|nr:hypothetical protein [Chitinophagaceae bacterium]